MKARFRWEQAVRDSHLPPARRHVLLTMATWMDNDTGHCHPSQETIAKATGLSTRTVRRHITAACDDGWLLKVRQGRHIGRGNSYSSEYMALVPTSAGGQQCPVADDPDPVDNLPAGGHQRPVGISQEDICAPQPDTSDPAAGHQCPPNSLEPSEKNSRVGEVEPSGADIVRETLARNGAGSSPPLDSFLTARRLGERLAGIAETEDALQESFSADRHLRNFPSLFAITLRYWKDEMYKSTQQAVGQ